MPKKMNLSICLEKGGWSTSGLYLICGLLIMLCLFATIHNRNLPKEVRQLDILMSWNEHGFFNLGGMRIYQDENKEIINRSKASIPQTFLYPGFFLEKIYYAIFKKYSYRLLALNNQVIILIGGALLGIMIFRLSKEASFEGKYAFLLGLSGQLVYQTFPWNLAQIFRLYPTSVFIIFMLGFLLVLQKESSDHKSGIFIRYQEYLKAVLIFFMVYTDYIHAIFIIFSYVFINWSILHKNPINKKNVLYLYFPALLAFFIFKLQVLYITIRFPDMQIYGAHFMRRSGLNGSTEFYKGIAMFFNRAVYFPEYMLSIGVRSQLPRLSNWWFFGIFGAIPFCWLYLQSLKGLIYLKYFSTISIMITAYLFLLFLLSQVAITHPFVYDIYLFLPLIVSTFVGWPLISRRMNLNTGIVVGTLIIYAFAYSMVQLRDYAICFPISRSDMWFDLPILFGHQI